MAEFDRPKGFRFTFGGINTRNLPDALSPTKYPYAQNIRMVSDQSIISRPGYTTLQSGFQAITDIRAYAALNTDNNPRFLVRQTSNLISLDTDTPIVTLNGAVGLGVSFMPFRPEASPLPWMYVAGLGDYQKIAAPPSLTAQKVGIAEPASNSINGFFTDPITAVELAPKVNDFTGAVGTYTASGSASSPSAASLITDTAGTVVADPLLSSRLSVAVGAPGLYLPGMDLTFAGGSPLQVQAVRPAAQTSTISAIKYYSGSTGLCEIVLSQDLSGVLQRGSLVMISAETVFVNWAITGPGGTCTIETQTTSGHSAAETVTGVACVIVYGSVTTGNAISSPTISTSVTVGTGTLTNALSSNPLSGFSGDDYVNVTLLLSDIAKVTTVTFAFVLGTSNATIYRTVTGSSLSPVAGELFQVHFQLSQMTGFTGIPTNVTGFQVSAVYTGTGMTMEVGGTYISGGYAPDVGDSGTPYFYRVKPRASLTGAVGNPTPVMRVGVNPRRQAVLVTVAASAAYDTQIDTWDLYREGGTITSYRYEDSFHTTAANYTDLIPDDDLTATNVLPVEDFEPWPSVDVPFSTTNSITVVGTLWSGSSSGFPASATHWLPGTLLTTNIGTFTLRSRPFIAIGTVKLEVEENGGSATLTSLTVNEPFVARSINPYIWGPDAYGVFFGVGDQYRPGFVSFSTPYTPDSVSDQNNIELCPPSEPLTRGEVLNGLSYVPSSKRWWVLYPTLTGTPLYQQIEAPVGKPSMAPYGIVSNGQNIYFWGPDGIYYHSGGPATSLTDDDLYGLFPRDGIPGENVVVYGHTIYAPDYSRVGTFRLSVQKDILYADYQDSTGTQRTLVCDLRTKAWSVDLYNDPVTVHYAPEQQEGTVQTTGTLYPLGVLGTSSGLLLSQKDLVKDGTNAIGCIVDTFEWDGGDMRAAPQWGDIFVDGTFTYGGSIQPQSQGTTSGGATAITGSNNRQFVVAQFSGGLGVSKFMGIEVAWTEAPTGTPTTRTTLNLWQPSFVSQPETITNRTTDWYDLQGASYVRGVRFTANTFNQSKSLTIRNGDTGATFTHAISFNGTQEGSLAIVPPMIAHTLRFETDSVPWILFPGSVVWDKDKWPELIPEYSPWMNLGSPGNKYLRGVIIPVDTNGASISLTITNELGTSINPTPVTFATTAGVKTPVAFSITVPFIGHEFQIFPSAVCRIWWEEIQFVYDEWPDSLTESSAWMNPGGGENAKYLLSAVIPMDTGGSPVSLQFRSSDTGTTTTLGPFTTTANQKTDVPMAFVAPFVCHELQITPTANARIWYNQIRWGVVPYPELIPAYTPIMTFSDARNQYVRSVRITADSANQPVSFTIQYDNGTTGPTVGPFSFNGKTTKAFSFTPFVAHNFQLIPNAAVRIWVDDCGWDMDLWPEFTAERSPWINPGGGTGAKYLLSATIPMDTEGVGVSLTFTSSDTGGTTVLGPFTTTSLEKTEVPMAFVAPFVCHQLQITPSGAARIWFDEIKWQVDPYPELIPAYTPIMEYSSGSDNSYVQGIKITGDSSNVGVSFTVLGDGGVTKATFGPLAFNGKETIAVSFPTPFLAHNWQLVPSGSVRIFTADSAWVFEPTPESVVNWGPTQWTAHGLTGYQSIYRIEASYSSNSTVSLNIVSQDGVSPSAMTLPSTGGVTKKVLLTPTFNKGQLYQYTASSSGNFQIFLNDWVVWVCQWGREGQCIQYRNLGGAFGDKASI